MRVSIVDFLWTSTADSCPIATRSSRYLAITASIFLGHGLVTAQECNPGEPQFEFPTVSAPDSVPSQCDGVGQVVPNLVNGVHDGTYRWETDADIGSQCWQQLFVYPNYYTEMQPPAEEGLPANDSCADSFYDQVYLPNEDLVYISDQSAYPFGFRTKFNPLTMPGLGTFLPPADTLRESSVALVPPGAGDKELSWNGASRATLHNQVDLITGLPLQQVNELELPFGGATFRLMRTRSGSRDDMQKRTNDQVNYGGLSDHIAANERWWDWAGQGWMISENPLLLVDSALPGPVGPQPVTTYLMLDAHHTIPFQQIESTGQYAAPPRFRARLEHNGIWDPEIDGGWEQYPTQYDIYLYDGELKYSFVVVREDIPDHIYQNPNGTDETRSYHERPVLPDATGNTDDHDPWGTCINPGLGIPYLGLCFRIEDRYGHEVRINYSDVNSQALDMDDTSGCIECSQSCQKKGMISSIELVSQGEPIWTLVYSYRGMYVNSSPGDRNGQMNIQYPENQGDNAHLYNDLWGGYHIDRIHVVDGFLATDELDAISQGLTVDHRDGYNLDHVLDLAESAPSAFEGNQDLSSLDDAWTYRVRNHFIPDENGGMWRAGLKVMTTVTQRFVDEDQGGFLSEESKDHWVYQYVLLDPGPESDRNEPGFPEDGIPRPSVESSKSIRWLSRMYTPDDVNELIRFWMADSAIRPDKPTGFPVFTSGDAILDSLVRMRSLENGGLPGLGIYSSSFASSQWHRRFWADWGDYSAPEPNKLVTQIPGVGQFVTRNKKQLHSDNYERTVRTVTVRDETGKKRHYQISRIRMSPFEATGESVNGGALFFGDPGHYFAGDPSQVHIFFDDYDYHQKSVFYAPFKWHHVKNHQSSSNTQGLESPNLTEPRWIVIIDEIPLGTTTGLIYEGEASIKDGQLSRRVVEMSASGHVLTDKLWEFTPDGVVRSGGGLGEQFIYMSAEDYFGADDDPNNDIPASDSGRDDFESIRNESLLVEYRSLGYSVESDKDTGLTRFIDYNLFNPVDTDTGQVESLDNYDSESEETIPLVNRIQPVAEGIRKGVSFTDYDLDSSPLGESLHPKLYKSQTFRSVTNPLDVIGAVEYAEPTFAEDTLSDMPTLDINSLPFQDYRVLHTIIERDSSSDEAQELPVHERDILSRMVVGVPKQVYPNSPYYYPVEREFYDPDTGYTIWSCTGLLRDPNNPVGWIDPTNPVGPPDVHETLTFTYYDRDSQGRSRHTVHDAVIAVEGEEGDSVFLSSNVHDADLIEYTDQNGTANAWPSEQDETVWRRIGQTPALEYVTSFKYDNRYGLVDVFFPDGRRWAKRVIGITGEEAGVDWDRGINREFIFNDLELVDGQWFTYSEGEVNDYKRNTGRTTHGPVNRRRVRFTSIEAHSYGDIRVSSNHRPVWEVKNSIKLSLDANGRMQEARLLERSASNQLLAVGIKQINDLGALYREQEIDGTITIQTRNSLGQTLRVYKGTESGDPFGIGAIGDPDNMQLVNRTQYGSSANNAWLPTVVRRYDMYEGWHKDTVSPYETVSDAADETGMPTVIGYDWQNRAVRTDTYARGVFDPVNGVFPRRLSTTLTYMDYSDRPYLEVTYGADSEDGPAVLDVSGIDPAEYVDGATFPGHDSNSPDVGQFVAGLTPLSVSYTIYSLNGTAVERRQYDPADLASSATPQYQAIYSYNGIGGQQVYSQSPGAPIGYTILDSLGRVASEISMEPKSHEVHDGVLGPEDLKQLARTDYTYDADGNVVETVSWVRTEDGLSELLDGSNAVRTRTWNWYNAQKRLIATAELGTEDTGGMSFVTPTDPLIPYNEAGDPPSFNPAVVGMFNRPAGVHPHALITLNEYDEDGNLTRTVNPKGIATTYEYSNTNRLLYKTENADAQNFEDKLMTAYRYQYGRLISMSQVTEDNRFSPIGGMALPVPGDLPEAGEGSLSEEDIFGNIDLSHTTGVSYGAEIVQLKHDLIEYRIPSTFNNSLVGALYLPDADTGEMSDEADVLLRYTTTGQIAERFDAAGGAFRYMYDELDRLISIETGSWDPSQANPPIFDGDDAGGPQGQGFAANGVIPPMDAPTDKIGYIEYVYDDRAGLAEVIAWTARDGPDKQKVAHSAMDYNQRGMLLAERQLHGDGGVDVNDPKVPSTNYGWSYEPTLNTADSPTGHHRLASIEYPVPSPNMTARELTMQYGADGSLDDLLSRIVGMNSNIGTVNVADFTYTADGRRSSIALKNSRIINDHRKSVSTGGLNGHDLFGRMFEEDWIDTTGGSNTTLYNAEYGYDAIGNRVFARIQQVDLFADSAFPELNVSRDNIRSTLSSYDDLNRLVGVEIGQLDEDINGNTLASMVGGSVVFEDSWNLDALGNWVADVDENGGSILAHGRESTGLVEQYNYASPPGISPLDSTAMSHIIDQQITWRDSISVLTDTTTLDGVTTTIGDDPETTEIEGVVPIYDGAGRLRFDGQYSYQYDTWGRLVQINRASPAISQGMPTYVHGELVKHYVYDGVGRLIRTTSPIEESAGDLETVDFYYDGVRLIQEIINDTISSGLAAMTSGDPGLENLAAQTTPSGKDGSTATMGLQGGQLDPQLERNIHREYVWGPGDGGVDEILMQSDETDDEFWCIQDAGGDLVALVSVPNQSDVQVVRQWTYGPYGEVLSSDHLGASIESHIGHKGLFVDRLDAPVNQNADESPRLVPRAHASYHNRNRTYQPGLGRFLQMDPNASGLALMSASASHGSGMAALGIAFSMQGMLGDGMNLYQYLGSNPWTRSDPMGLSWDPFDMVDEFMAVQAGAVAAFLDRLGKSAKAAAFVAATVASYLPFPAAAISGQLALAILNGETLTMDVIIRSAIYGMIPGGIGKLGPLIKKLGGRIFASTARIASRYGSTGRGGGSFLATAIGGGVQITGKALQWLNQGVKDTLVYLATRNGKPVYVGITKRTRKVRLKEHKRAGKDFDELVPLTPRVTHFQAKAIEQVVIMANPNFENRINSIGPNGVYAEYFKQAVTWGVEFMGKNRIKYAY